MKWAPALIAALVVCGSSVFAQERALLPPPPPMRNPMLMPDKVLPLPPSLGSSTAGPGVQAEPETPGWIMRRRDSGKWQVLWQGRWVGKNQMMGTERIINIDEYGIQVQGSNGKRNIPVVGINLGRQQKENK